MENEEKIKKLTPEESFNEIFKHLDELSGCFEPEGKKIILEKIKELEKSYKIESEMKLALHDLGNSLKRKSIIIKEFVLEKTGVLRDNISSKVKDYKKNRYFKNKKKQMRNREKYES